ncbi:MULTISPECIES: 2-phospho-L-lactate guanylyltransferase [Cryobacterium]|uniref:Phosphoenolpyruvate guanylyltransferase n=1 Tax=Cryobacterium glucosi TaxID=1259175 RepID=A0ABY2ILQ4_9MICO|nr:MULTISPECIES: 2-phospho-L-lactate guanylyltransferase [Cryobacterium]MDY7529802.1 2-phospho-L-lactate guanylyltransferase [Cryobacterium sp. 10C2]MEB0203617.1 2-phospho-L-lactate guanylyltransferase [Cryobacterium sp. 5I3]MEB0292358.1 2-phospho-L-lactate guanylyltransferase [Cryobacterium sp. 10C2]TFB93785.1 2-phospho-L-lactate guanylyltransferase [Cryobacterium sp. MDB2-A-1]TFC09004.1 2-phospho-L-lactate guanylyltransferase [Cryobacterium sp. MDB2-33-2]
MSWVVVVPVKGNPGAKTRLGGAGPDRAELADAFALDTVAALAAAAPVLAVFVVTGDTVLGARLARLGAHIVAEVRDPVDPLNAAIDVGLAAAAAEFPAAHRAVITGDLPALTADDVERTLALAAHHERSMVPDADRTGTTTLLALAGVPISPRFGSGSRAAHEAAGHVPLTLPAGSGIRRDVDTPADLALVERLGAGPYTSALLTAASAAPQDSAQQESPVPPPAALVPSPDRPLEK